MTPLYGTPGDDTLAAVPGTSGMIGGTGSDTYVIGNTFYFDITINDNNTLQNDERFTTDTVYFQSGITLDSLRIDQVPSRIKIYLGDPNADSVLTLYNGPYSNMEEVYFTDGNVTYQLDGRDLIADDGHNTITLARGNYHQHGGGGNDTLIGNTDNNHLFGDAGNDTLIGGDGNDRIYGGDGNDVIRSDASSDYMYGEAGNDAIFDYIDGGYVDGGPGNDTLNLFQEGQALRIDMPGQEAEVIGQGSLRNDFFNIENVVATNFDDQITGDAQNNSIFTHLGDDSVDAGAGNDIIYTTANADVIGGAGIDAIGFTYELTYGVSINLTTGAMTNFNGHTGTVTGFENVAGTPMNDVIVGDPANNVINGLAGDDVISAAGGNDTILGGAGYNQMTGGGGADTFLFQASTAYDTPDEIIDFTITHGDKINISNLLGGYDANSHTLTDFVQITDDGTHSYLAVDANGGADNFVPVTRIDDVTGLDPVSLVAIGLLIAG